MQFTIGMVDRMVNVDCLSDNALCMKMDISCITSLRRAMAKNGIVRQAYTERLKRIPPHSLELLSGLIEKGETLRRAYKLLGMTIPNDWKVAQDLIALRNQYTPVNNDSEFVIPRAKADGERKGRNNSSVGKVSKVVRQPQAEPLLPNAFLLTAGRTPQYGWRIPPDVQSGARYRTQ